MPTSDTRLSSYLTRSPRGVMAKAAPSAVACLRRAHSLQHVFTSLNLFLKDVKTALHVDGNNEGHPNLVAGISDFRGKILVENPHGELISPTKLSYALVAVP